MTVSHPEKVLYPGGKFTKAGVVDYYRRIAPYLLPHFHNRPVTLKRYPDGVFGEAFYEKDAPGFTPEWVQTFPVPRREGGPDINYILINDRRTIMWAASIAALELHPFLHCVPHIDRPTHIVFDLDPGEGMNVLNCAEISFLLREVLTKLRLKSFPKVSGSKGIQVYVPLNTPVTYNETQSFARATAEFLEKTHPDKVVADMAKNLRVGKIFIDWSQNADFKTTVGVYSLRAKRPRPYVSMPVRWGELSKAVKKSSAALLDFEPDEALRRLKRIGDLFAPLRSLKQKLPKEFATGSGAKSRTTRSALADYNAKRDFTRTTEPSPNVPRRSAQGSRRRFAVQKHAASHLHYDLRLEMHDVLKSWAVPKGIPLRENEIRTAFQTEDHPVEYLQFEGVIPRGEYGAGTIMVWDLGTFEVIDGNYWKGRLAVFLNGKKLKGEWRLERIGDENGKTRWSLRKTGANRKSISSKQTDRSAVSGLTMDEIAAIRSGMARRSVATAAAAAGHSKNAAPQQTARTRSKRRKNKSVAAPRFVSPMKATAVTELPRGDEWIYEVKWDGYRALGLKHHDQVRLLSLKEKDLTTDFPAVANALRSLDAEAAVIDGEIVAVDPNGCPSFQALQNRASMHRDWQIVYYAFDLLNLQGEDWTKQPLKNRKEKLREILQGSDIRYNANLSGSPEAILRTIESVGLEGVVAKKSDSLYRAGTRVTSWLKFKVNKAQEFVIGGYKPDAGSFQSILVGYYDAKKLIFSGKVRQGFNPASRAKLYKVMQQFITAKCPFANLPSSRKSHFGEGITADEMQQLCWLRPKLVAQISFTEWTNYGLLRHATFEGLRDDKEPRAVVCEMAAT